MRAKQRNIPLSTATLGFGPQPLRSCGLGKCQGHKHQPQNAGGESLDLPCSYSRPRATLRCPALSNDNRCIHNEVKAEMRLFKASLLLLSIVMPLTTSAQNKIFPYKYFTDDLPNGLRVITVPTDYPN